MGARSKPEAILDDPCRPSLVAAGHGDWSGGVPRLRTTKIDIWNPVMPREKGLLQADSVACVVGNTSRDLGESFGEPPCKARHQWFDPGEAAR